MGNMNILDKGDVNREDMQLALDYVRNNTSSKNVMHRLKSKKKLKIK